MIAQKHYLSCTSKHCFMQQHTLIKMVGFLVMGRKKPEEKRRFDDCHREAIRGGFRASYYTKVHFYGTHHTFSLGR